MAKPKMPSLKVPSFKMPFKLGKGKGQGTAYLCQVTEGYLKVACCILEKGSKKSFIGLEIEPIAADIDDKKLQETLNSSLKKLAYNGSPLIISIPRNKVTTRFIKVPTQNPKEIEDIASLQASRYLPYPAQELITGHQIIAQDKAGYSEVNLVIMHKDVAGRYLNIFNQLKVVQFSLILSSYGLLNFYNYTTTADATVVMLADIDYPQVELVILREDKLLFSRYFKIDQKQAKWEELFASEITKSRDAYLKETAKEPPEKIFLSGAPRLCLGLTQILNKKTGLAVEVLDYGKVKLTSGLSDKISASDNSFASLLGLGLKDVEPSLNLLPSQIKEKSLFRLKRQQALGLVVSIIGIILVLGIGLGLNLRNKATYLEKLKLELSRVTKEASPFEETEKRFNLMLSNLQKKPTSLDVLSEVSRLMPEGVYLLNLSYKDLKEILIRGEAEELNSVFAFAAKLEKSGVLKKFDPKVRYATYKKTASGEVVSFEIICLK